MINAWPPKDPDEVLDYSVDWNAVLDADADDIDSVAWTVPTGLTLESQSVAAGIATVWLSGGVAGSHYQVGCRVVTLGGRTHDRSLDLQVWTR